MNTFCADTANMWKFVGDIIYVVRIVIPVIIILLGTLDLGKAVMAGEDKKIKATGYNGTPSKVTSCYEIGKCYRIENNIPSGTRYETCRSIHAEQNAIIQAGQDRCKDATMYIYGHNFICILCKRFIVQAGIKDVYLQKDENSPVEYVTVEQIRQELDADRP